MMESLSGWILIGLLGVLIFFLMGRGRGGHGGCCGGHSHKDDPESHKDHTGHDHSIKSSKK